MTVDSSAEVAQTTASSSEQSADTAPAGSVSTDTSTSDQSAPTSADAGVAQATNPTDDGSHASLQGNSEADSVAPTQAPDWQRQYKEVQGWATRTRQENIQLQQQLKELQTQFQASQKQATDPQKQLWDEDHAEHAQFMRLVDKAEFYEELIQGESDPGELQKLHAKMQRALGDKGIETLNAWRADVRRQERERRLNPKAFYSKLIRAEAQPVVQETLQSTSQNYQQMIQARDQAQKWVKDNPEVASRENIQAVLSMMEKGVKFEQASAQVERDHYRNLVSNAKKMSASAEEKERLLQGNAAGAIHRNPTTSKRVDVGKYLNDKGIQSSRDKIDALFDLDRQGML